MKNTILIILIIFSNLAFANEKAIEIWECQNSYSWENILVEATVLEGRKFGHIIVAGVNNAAQFAVKGFDRRWDFGLQEDNTFDYAFVMKPDGTASYYDFSIPSNESLVKPSMVLKCRMRKEN